MGYLCLFILMTLWFLSFKISRTIISPGSAFTLLFSFVFFLSLTGWFGMYQSDSIAYIYITIGVCCFLMGTFTKRSHSYSKVLFKISFHFDKKEIFIERRYNLMIIICLAILSISAINIIQFIISGGTMGDVYVVAAAATDGDDNELSKNSFQVLLESYIAYPLLYTLVPVSLVEFFHTYKKKYIIIAVTLAILRVCLDARRTYLTSFIMMTALCVYLHKNDYKYYNLQMKKQWKIFRRNAILVLGAFVYIFIYVSQQRSIAATGEDNSNTLRTLTQYYGGSVQFFGDCINTIKISNTFGFSTFRGLLAPFFGILKIIGIDSPSILENANSYLSELHAHLLHISPDKVYNSFATCFFQFYCDGGMLGIIVFSFIYGYYAEYIFEKLAVKRSRCAESIYVFFFANILMLSFVNIQTVLALNFWPLVIINLLYKKGY